MPYIPAVNYSRSGAPDAPDTQVITINQFSGADLTSRSSLMSPTRSPDCRNMMRASPGKVKRRMGYEHISSYDGRINGATKLQDAERGNVFCAVHAGTKIYFNDTVIAGSREEAIDAYESGEPISDTGVADARSCVVGMKTVNGICLLDGQAIRRFVHSTNLHTDDRIYYCPKISDNPYVPTVMIDRDPIGGGTAHEDINLLSDAFTELFFADGASTVYQMSLDELDESKGTIVKTMNDDGLTWTQLTEGSDYSVDYTTGCITFTSAPAETPVSGQSNVSITASKDRSEKRSWIDKCTIGICFGDTDTGSRLFVAGNPDYPNRDFWSELDNASYFSDLNYSILGGRAKIVGYSMIGDKLATHKSDGTIYVRTAVTDENNMYRQYFPVTSVIRGPENIAPYSFAALDNEPLFLTKSGIYALTSADLTAEKYAQLRSFYLNGRLLSESNLSQSVALVYGDMYLLAVNGSVYVLDGTTKTYAHDEPHSTYQYEGFLWTGIPARCLWIWDDALHFGDDEGNVYRFSEGLYTDNGQPFTACWQTPELQGSSFYHYKSMKRLAMQLAPGEETEVAVSADTGGGWQRLFSHLFAFSEQLRVLVRRIKLNKCVFAAFRLESAGAQPFEPDVINIEYTQTGRHDKRL